MFEKMKTFLGDGGRYGSYSKYAGKETKSFNDDLEKDYHHSDAFDYMDEAKSDREFFKKGGGIDIKHPGKLHREMDIPEGKKIPCKALKHEKAKARKEGDKTLMKEVVFAENAKKFKHK